MYERFDLENRIADLKARYNVAPSQWMPVVIRDEVTKHNQAELMRWGLIPHWAKDPKIAYMMINARAETLDKKPSFSVPLKKKRCLIPATGFFEWRVTKEGKVPYYIKLKDEDMFAFAGLYDDNDRALEKPVRTYTIITTEPNKLLEPIHNRMPVILKKTTENIWLDPEFEDVEKLKGMLVPYAANLMEAYPVSTLVNTPYNDVPEILKPA